MKIKDKLQSRREFFKEASEKALPILGMALLTSTPLLNSCTKDPEPSECNGCSNNCEGNSTSTTCSACSNNCENSSTSSGCSSCSDNCSDSCNTECTNDCSVNCSNSANNTPNDTISEASGSVDGHEYVDLGLSVMWARCNINATQPQNAGLFADIPYNNLSLEEQISLLQSMGLYSATQSIKELGGNASFDLATERWGNNWKTPSDSEWIELRDNCNFEAYELEGVTGVKAISQINGKSIFIPLSGVYFSNSMHDIGSMVDFHSSTFQLQYVYIAHGLYRFSKRTTGLIQFNHYGTSQRPFTRAVTTGSGGGSTNCNGNCTNTAQNNCSNCQVGCSTGCSQQCASNCSTGCKTTCSGTCPNGCSTLCGGACKSSCGGTCSYVSSGSSCTSGTCATTCLNYCFRTCSLACSENCMSCCITSSK